MCWGIGVWSIIGGGMRESKIMRLFSKLTTKKLRFIADIREEKFISLEKINYILKMM